MTTKEIQLIGIEMSKRRLRSRLFTQLKEVRPDLSWNTLYRAFKDVDCKTDVLDWIRDEARAMLAGMGVTYEAGVLEGA